MSVKENLFLQTLIPIYNDDDDLTTKEDFTPYFYRVNHLAPNIPSSVLYDFIYLNFDMIAHRYVSLNFEKMRFSKEMWSTKKIYQNVKSDDMDSIDKLGYQLYTALPKSRLQKYVLEQRKWPLPIIILENKEGQHLNEYGRSLGHPFHLLEGHFRLNYLREIYRREPHTLPESFTVWKVTINE